MVFRLTPPDDAAVRELSSPLHRAMLRRLGPHCRVVALRTTLAEDEYRRVGEWLAAYPAVTLSVGPTDGSIRDLDFLRHFPQLRRFSANVLRYQRFESFEGLGCIPEARSISLGQTPNKISLLPLAGASHLQHLSLEGHSKDIAILARLTRLIRLRLRSITLPDLSLLQPLTRLRSLDLKLGGTKDLSLLPSIGRLEYLELWMIRGLRQLDAVADLPYLQYLHLESLKQVAELPDMSRLAALRTVWLENMRGVVDLRPLLAAPQLEQLALVAMTQLRPLDVAVLAGHPRLRSLRAGLGSAARNHEVHMLLPLLTDGDWTRPHFPIDDD